MISILVVDDEPRICRFLCRALEPVGYHVDTANTAADAVEKVASRDYALVILDLMLPDSDGLDLLPRLLAAAPSVKVLVLSAVTETAARVRALQLGAVDYLGKPFAVAELVERVRHRIGETSQAPTQRWLTVGGARLDLHRRALVVDGRTVALATREFVLLQHLMRRANEVCTRAELLNVVWGYSFDPGSNVVDVCVRRLRAKLPADVIETVRNVGYSFTDREPQARSV
jgi:two-component system copper resistance phosphate regulon response regulator CusR